MRSGSCIGFALCGLLGAVLCACQTARPVLVAPRGPAQAQRPVLFEAVRIFDGKGDALSPPSDLLVADGRIAAIALHGGARGGRASVHVGSPQDALDAAEAGAALLTVWQDGRRLVRK